MLRSVEQASRLLANGNQIGTSGDACATAPAMRVIIQPDADAASRRAARFVAELVRKKPNCVLGLATGNTPLGTYRELIRLHKEEGLDFSQVTTFNLDEYVGLGPAHPQSYRAFMQQNLFDHINLDPGRTNIPDGRALDFELHCRQYEQRIRDLASQFRTQPAAA